MPLILGTNSIKDTGYDVANSCRFNVADNAKLSRSISGSPTDPDKFTISFWMKKTALSNQVVFGNYANANFRSELSFSSDDRLQYFQRNDGSATFDVVLSRQFRDPNAWFHIVFVYDTGQGTDTNRFKFFVNGVHDTNYSHNSPFPAQDLDGRLNQASQTLVIGQDGNDAKDFNGYLAEVVLIDGQALDADQFGEFDSASGIWKPIDVSGLTFGDDGFYLDFEDSGDLGDDESGNGNDFTESNLAATDQSIDTCTNNFAVWNGLQPTNATLTEGNLVGASSASSGHYSGISSIGVSSGKWYFECKQTQESTANEGMIGVIIFDGSNTLTALLNPVGRGGGWGMQDGTRGFSTDSGGSGSTTDNFHAGWTDDDIIGIALDIDNSRVYFSKNGQWNNSGSWDASSPTTSQTLQNGLGDGTYFFMAGDASGSNNNTWSANFGSPAFAISSGNTDGEGLGNFEFAVPSGYFALCTKNLAEYG